MPGSGLISERNHTAGEKIHCDAFGCVRQVLDLNGHSTVLLRPSAPTASLIRAHLVAGVPQLAQRLELRTALAHVLESLAAHVELAPLSSRGQARICPRASGIRRTARAEMPIAGRLAHVDAVLRVDRRAPWRRASHARCFLSAAAWNISMSIGTPRCSINADTAANSPQCSAVSRSMLRQQLAATTAPAHRCRPRSTSKILSRSSELNGQPCMMRFAHGVLALGPDGSRARNSAARRSSPLPSGAARPLTTQRNAGSDRGFSPAPASPALDGRPLRRWRRSRRTARLSSVRYGGVCRAGRATAEWSAPSATPCAEADHVGTFAGLRNELEVDEPDLLERAAQPTVTRRPLLKQRMLGLSINRPLSRKASRKIFAGFNVRPLGSAKRPAGAGNTL